MMTSQDRRAGVIGGYVGYLVKDWMGICEREKRGRRGIPTT